LLWEIFHADARRNRWNRAVNKSYTLSKEPNDSPAGLRTS
jgi:hypothetical protein